MTSTSVTSPLKRSLLRSICGLLMKKSFIMSRKDEEWIPFDVARDDKTKIVISSKANIEAKSCYYFINSKVCGLII